MKVSLSGSPSLAHERANLRDGLDCAYLVVREHDRDEHRVVAQGRAHVLNAHDPFFVDGQPRNLPPALLQSVADAARRGVLDGRGYDMSSVARVLLRDAAYG